MAVILTLEETAAIMGVTRRTLERLREEGKAPPIIQLSKRRLGVVDDELYAWLGSRRQSASLGATAGLKPPDRPRYRFRHPASGETAAGPAE